MTVQSGGRTDGPVVRVLYIGGEGRSGSTVLERALAAHPEVVGVGELKYLWRWGIQRQEFCACGKPVPDCEFWSAVGRRLFGPEGFAAAEASSILDEYETVAANRRMFAAYLAPLLPHSRRRLDRVRRFLSALYAAVASEAGAAVVVDASKHPMHLGLIRRAPGLDLTVAHLVRDPCGVTASWSRRVPLPHDPTGRRTMGPHPAPIVVGRWALMNLAVQYVRVTAGGVLVRYEDLCRRPRATLGRILASAGLDPGLLPRTADIGRSPAEAEALVVSSGHGIAGNPARFGSDVLVVEEDAAWRTTMARSRRALIKAAVLPQAVQYRYLRLPFGRRSAHR